MPHSQTEERKATDEGESSSYAVRDRNGGEYAGGLRMTLEWPRDFDLLANPPRLQLGPRKPYLADIEELIASVQGGTNVAKFESSEEGVKNASNLIAAFMQHDDEPEACMPRSDKVVEFCEKMSYLEPGGMKNCLLDEWRLGVEGKNVRLYSGPLTPHELHAVLHERVRDVVLRENGFDQDGLGFTLLSIVADCAILEFGKSHGGGCSRAKPGPA
jgi:hypothetical protein